VLYISCGEARIGSHGLIEVLKAIEETGSLRAAATRLGINYRRLWARIRRAERLLGKQLVAGDKRGSRLTDEAKKIITAYEEALGRLREAGLLQGVETSVDCKE